MSKFIGHFVIGGPAPDVFVYDDALVRVWTGWRSIYADCRRLGFHPAFLGAGFGGAGILAGAGTGLAASSLEEVPRFGSPEETAEMYSRATLVWGEDVDAGRLWRNSRSRNFRQLTLTRPGDEVVLQWIVKSNPDNVTIPLLKTFLGDRLDIDLPDRSRPARRRR